MVSYKIKLNFITDDTNHYLNFVIANLINIDIPSNPRASNIKYLIGTRLLLKNNKAFTIVLNSLKGVKFKYLIRKYMKENWKVKVKDITIKHINNIYNNHNYIVLVKKRNKQLKKFQHRISSVDPITWRIFYETYVPTKEESVNSKKIYNTINTIKESRYSCKININGKKTDISKIYKIISEIL